MRSNGRGKSDDDIAADLAKLGYPANVVAISKKTIPPAYLNAGLLQFTAFKSNSEPKNLDYACKFGHYDALRERSEMSYNIVTSDNVDENGKLKAVNVLLADLNKISDLYWSVGNLHAASMLLNIGNYYDNVHRTSQDTDASSLAQTYWEQAAEHYVRAKLFLDLRPSEELVRLIYPETGLAITSFQSIEQADGMFLAHLATEKTKAIYEKIEKEKREIVSSTHPALASPRRF